MFIRTSMSPPTHALDTEVPSALMERQESRLGKSCQKIKAQKTWPLMQMKEWNGKVHELKTCHSDWYRGDKRKWSNCVFVILICFPFLSFPFTSFHLCPKSKTSKCRSYQTINLQLIKVFGIRFKPKKAINKLGWSGLFLELLEMEKMEIWNEM